MSAAMEYISKRPAPGALPTNTIEHSLPLSSPTSSLSFPKPEASWAGRDVSPEDWRAFTEQLRPQGPNNKNADVAENEGAYRRRSNYVVEEWNAEFFKPRGLRVNPVFEEKATEKVAESGPKGLRFKVGNTFVGLATSPGTGGFGLKLPGGVLLGVATEKNKAAAEQKR